MILMKIQLWLNLVLTVDRQTMLMMVAFHHQFSVQIDRGRRLGYTNLFDGFGQEIGMECFLVNLIINQSQMIDFVQTDQVLKHPQRSVWPKVWQKCVGWAFIKEAYKAFKIENKTKLCHIQKRNLQFQTKTTNFVHSTANIWRPKLQSVITSSLLCDNILRNFSYKVGM